MTGFRIGYILAPSEIINVLNNLEVKMKTKVVKIGDFAKKMTTEYKFR